MKTLTIETSINLDILSYWWDDPKPAFDVVCQRVRERIEQAWPDATVIVHEEQSFGWHRPTAAYDDEGHHDEGIAYDVENEVIPRALESFDEAERNVMP